MALGLLLAACTKDTDTEIQDTDVDVPRCADGAPVVPFDAEGPYGTHRHDRVEDFAVPLVDGSTWRLSEPWTGCDVHIVASSRVADFDGDVWWQAGLAEILAASPDNATYLFVPMRDTEASAAEVSARGTSTGGSATSPTRTSPPTASPSTGSSAGAGSARAPT